MTSRMVNEKPRVIGTLQGLATMEFPRRPPSEIPPSKKFKTVEYSFRTPLKPTDKSVLLDIDGVGAARPAAVLVSVCGTRGGQQTAGIAGKVAPRAAGTWHERRPGATLGGCCGGCGGV